MLTAKDFDVVCITCPVCQRPAKVYSRKGHNISQKEYIGVMEVLEEEDGGAK